MCLWVACGAIVVGGGGGGSGKGEGGKRGGGGGLNSHSRIGSRVAIIAGLAEEGFRMRGTVSTSYGQPLLGVRTRHQHVQWP